MAIDVGFSKSNGAGNSGESLNPGDKGDMFKAAAKSEPFQLNSLAIGQLDKNETPWGKPSGTQEFDARPDAPNDKLQKNAPGERSKAEVPDAIVNLRRNVYEHNNRTDIAGSIEAAEHGEAVGKALSENKAFQGHGQIQPADRERLFSAMDTITSRTTMDHMQGYINHNSNSRFQIQLGRSFSKSGTENTIAVVDQKTGINMGSYKRPFESA